ncbi:PEPxxWA-CTERM sorting domain-containing protein [Qipengyuania sediminis]|uniref:PEPxxWA-CTERM sorting domain-containing protein n=1 Tax=Qipengyuania sediminis TaxID=1532023 RepID=UPI001F0E1126|nr:PEPxxWA-CTERM sorting domain-containing protein [Qipengyuania sediminis]
MTTGRYLAAGLLAATALPSAASAGVTVTGVSGDPGFLTGRIIYTPGGIGGNAGTTSADLSIGRMKFTGFDTATAAALAFNTYCIDIFNYVQNGTFDLQTFTLGNAVKEEQLKALLSNTAGLIGGAATLGGKKDISAAIQLAVWEIVNESGNNGYSLSGGLFQVSATHGSAATNARALAQGYLNSLGGWSAQPGFNFSMLSAVSPANNQRQILFAPVPEPGTWALLIAGFGAVGGAMRRRTRTRLAYA